MWSSSEESRFYARLLYTVNGLVNYSYKDYYDTFRRVRAFLRPTAPLYGQVRSILRAVRGVTLRLVEMSATKLRTALAHFVMCVPDSTYGSTLWSSSENSRTRARSLATNHGYVITGGKETYITYRRVRVSTYGSILWSSSESSQLSARYLYTHDGHVNISNKDNYITGRRVRACYFFSSSTNLSA